MAWAPCPADHAVMNADHPLETARQNHLLAALGADAWARLSPHLQCSELRAGQVIAEPARSPLFAIFPTTAIVSLMVHTRDGGTAEVAVVGHEGAVGLSLYMGGNVTPGQAVVQSEGLAWQLNSQVLKEETARAGPALHLLLRYTQALMAQVAQTAACNRHHSIDQQLCRRLLLGLDRSHSEELVMTQEAVSQMLGVRREGVTAAALKLQEAGVIRYRRGHISVLDRPRLEARACECYSRSGALRQGTALSLQLVPARLQPPRPAPQPLHHAHPQADVRPYRYQQSPSQSQTPSQPPSQPQARFEAQPHSQPQPRAHSQRRQEPQAA
jgi:CRP-like cAMP-binding protein